MSGAASRGLQPGASGGKLRTLLAFSIFGFVTTTVAPIVFAACYLIVPYPRPLVVLIETLPAIGVKFLVPHLVSHVPGWLRPLAVATGMMLASALIDLITPNVHPPVRILMTLLAAAASAASEVSFLALLRQYGRAGLMGWGAGTGAGALAVAVMPYVLTYRRGLFLRSAVGYTYYLIPGMLLAYWFVLPRTPATRSTNRRAQANSDIEGETAGFIIQSASADPTFRQQIERNLKNFGSLVMPYMLPLFVSSTLQGIIFPGISRSFLMSPAFVAYSSYYAAYGLAFHLGNFCGRVLAALARSQKAQYLISRLVIAALLLVVNAGFLLVPFHLVVFAVVLATGFMCGTIYTKTFVAVVEDQGPAPAADQEYSLGVVGIGETAGVLAGACIGAVLEKAFCSMSLGGGQRWCHSVR